MEAKGNQRPKRERKAAATPAASTAAAKTKPAAKKQKTATPKAAAPKAGKAKPADAAGASTTKATKVAPVKEKSSTSSKRKGGPLEVGTEAPPFSVKDQDGSEVTLESFKGSHNVVVFFYPKDNTEACKFRDLKKEYDALDCVVLGVSADHEVSHGKFIAKYGLTFSLLADTDRSLIKSYGASKAGDKIQRSTVLIDKDGMVAAVWNPVSGAEQHPVQVLAKLKEVMAA